MVFMVIECCFRSKIIFSYTLFKAATKKTAFTPLSICLFKRRITFNTFHSRKVDIFKQVDFDLFTQSISHLPSSYHAFNAKYVILFLYQYITRICKNSVHKDFIYRHPNK